MLYRPPAGTQLPVPLPMARIPPPGFIRSIDSFRVLTECPLIVMLLFQLYAKYIKQSVPVLVPVMMDFLGQAPPPSAARLQRERYKEFIAAQVCHDSSPLIYFNLIYTNQSMM